MPVRSRELSDQTTEARLREVIRYMVNQEIQRLVRSTTGPITGGGGSSITETTLTFFAQVWDISVPEAPLLTTWGAESFTPGGGFNVFRFNTKTFNSIEPTLSSGGPTASYDSVTSTLSLDWGSPKSGTVSVLNYGGVGYGVIATADT